MPTAYQYISGYEENEEDTVAAWILPAKVSFYLEKGFNIEYEKMEGKGKTRVQCDKANEDTIVEGDYIQVFCDDLKEFLIDRKSNLSSLHLLGVAPDRVIAQIHECVELALKSRSHQLQVIKTIGLRIFGNKQPFALLKYIIPTDMMHIYFESADIHEISTFLRNWNQGCRLEVHFIRSAYSTENMMSVREMLNYPSIFVRIIFSSSEKEEWSKERLMLFFKPWKPYSPVFGEENNSFRLDNQSDEMNLSEQIGCVSLQDTRSLEVFGNPFLMKKILERIEWFYVYQSREILQYKNDWHVNQFVYCGDQLIERIVNDFKINIEHQKSIINELILDGDAKLTESIGNVLKSRDTPLNVKKLEMKATHEKDVMKILPYLDSVEDILIDSHFTVRLYLNDVPKLEQWKNAHALEVKNCTILNSIPELNLHNFKFIDIRINSISTDDVIYLKEIATQSVVSFNIHYNNSEIDASLYTNLPPYGEPDFKCIWYIPLSIPEKFLKIELDEPQETLLLFHIDRKDVPGDFLNALN